MRTQDIAITQIKNSILYEENSKDILDHTNKAKRNFVSFQKKFHFCGKIGHFINDCNLKEK